MVAHRSAALLTHGRVSTTIPGRSIRSLAPGAFQENGLRTRVLRTTEYVLLVCSKP